jgi:transposase
MHYLGIDVGKTELHAALLSGDRMSRKSVPNSDTGITQLQAWLRNRDVDALHVCLEATGGWSEPIGMRLVEAGHRVSIVNPARIKAFAQSELLRTKTDAVDAALIARFCRAHDPAPWSPPTPEILALQGLVRRYQHVLAMRAEEQNRLQGPGLTEAVRESLQAMIGHLTIELERLDRQITEHFDDHPDLRRQRELLTSIPGIGETTAARILSEMPNLSSFRDVKAVSAFAGLSPRHYQSGAFKGTSRLSKAGSTRLRTALYFPAITGMRYNPVLRALAERLRTRGKPAMVIIAALMRKLLTLAYGILKSKRPFDPLYAR